MVFRMADHDIGPDDDFLDRGYADRCPVSWCDRTVREHERAHQGVIWQAVRMPPAWRGRSIMTAQAVLVGHDEESPEVGLTLITDTLAQLSIVLDRTDTEKLRDALTMALEKVDKPVQ